MPAVDAIGQRDKRFADLIFGHDDLRLALVDPVTGRMLAALSDVATHSIAAWPTQRRGQTPCTRGSHDHAKFHKLM